VQHKNLLVVGLGHVGLSWSGYLVKLGHKVFGVDLSRDRVEALNCKKLPFQEEGLEDLLFKGPDHFQADYHITKSIDYSAAFLCTPLTTGRDLHDLIALVKAAAQVAPLVYIKSTLPIVGIDQLLNLVTDLAEQGVQVSYLPEFFREGAATEDIQQGYIVNGTISEQASIHLGEILQHRPVHSCQLKEAVALKLVSNAWHGLKVTFANEVHQLCRQLDEPSDRVMELFCMDRRLNISDSYLQPGPPFGGYCLPKDIGFINETKQNLPIMSAILDSNNQLILHITERIISLERKRIYWFGKSFKPQTDDVRNSINLAIAHHLANRNYDVQFVGQLSADELADQQEALVVLGPRELTSEEQKSLMQSGLKILDLGYYPSYRKQFIGYENYEFI
jgi:GDP-mannose 6-dehydrogenase